jgi:hypothetical protein
MRVALSGSSGFIGSALVPSLAREGHRVIRLVRALTAGPEQIPWDPETGRLDPAQLEGVDAIVHLAGEPVVGRWTRAKKARIHDSRVRGTRLLAETMSQLAHPPKVLVCASAIGYYGDRGEERLTEESPAGAGFLAEVCENWEAAAQAARAKGVRVVSLRIGVVLSPRGGALKMMLPAFRLGVGGRLGDGRQYFSWVALDDVVGAIQHALITDGLAGPVNAVAPTPVTNAEFTRTLGRVLRRPVVFPVPTLALRLLFGELADEGLLASARVEPRRLLSSGYRFVAPELEPALRHLLGRP